ncbi:MAG: 16S rRNA (cytosine(967)-C(5))-methyltransferase RsmB [Caldithrix sp.]|nr:16S rRNA (cytosine(967)-C(5))-methyltransferase RsmB [Caldithrix sp.]
MDKPTNCIFIMTKNQTKSNKSSSPRNDAFKIVLKFEQQRARLDDLLEQVYTQSALSARDKRLLRHLASGTVRYLIYLDWIIDQLYSGEFKRLMDKLKTLLRLALYEIIFVDKIPPHATVHEYVNLAKNHLNLRQSKIVNGILRNYLRKQSTLIPQHLIHKPAERISIQYAFPHWLVQRWIEFWGIEETEQLCRSLNEPPAFDLIVNTKKIPIDDFKQKMETQQISYETSQYFPHVLKIKDVQSVRDAGLLKKDWCRIQDESAILPVKAMSIKETDIVLDVSAAPGGKYLQIIEKRANRGLTIAADINKNRLQKVRENMTRFGYTGYYVIADGRYPPFKPVFDIILLDAPCSGIGVIRKHPDIKWRRDIHQITEFSELQGSLLKQAASILKRNGRLIYATCTIEPLENEKVVESFLRQYVDTFFLQKSPETAPFASREGMYRTFPHKHQTDGSFFAIFQKTNDDLL